MVQGFDPTSFSLSKSENEKIFRNFIWPVLRADARPSNSPKAVFVGGQPASGKTGIRTAWVQQRGGVVIDGDDLRAFHPQFDVIKREEPLSLTACTSRDSGRWIQKCILSAIQERVSVAIETTMRSPETVVDTIKKFKSAGFDVEVNVVAVKPMITWRRCCYRRELMFKLGTPVRNVPKEIHDAASRGVIATVSAIERETLASASRVYDLEGRIIYEGGRAPRGRVEQILKDEHGRNLSLVESLAHDFTWGEVLNLMKARSADRSELAEVENYREADALENRLR
jgi:UDP-N-acetylglucosamine kinase